MVERLAREKALAIGSNLGEQERGTVVIGADTTVVVGNDVLEKPADEKDAARMLRLLSGRSHQVITGVCLAGNGFVDVRHETTTVFFDKLTRGDIEGYITTREPMDKAGAYAIQGVASRWIPRIEGDYFNVVGLPVALLVRMLKEHGAMR
jgi:septum formation protein